MSKMLKLTKQYFAERGITWAEAREERITVTERGFRIPYFDQFNNPMLAKNGEPFYRERILDSDAILGIKGKPKFLQNPGKGNVRAYYCSRTRSVIWDWKVRGKRETLRLTEGEPKAIKLTNSGFPCIGIGGVDNFRTRSLPLIRDLDDIDWTDRTAVLVYDADYRQKRAIRRAAERLGRELIRRGALLKIVVTPPEPGAPLSSWGIDDFLVAEGPEAYRKLEKEAPTIAALPGFEFTEVGFANRIDRDHGDRLRYDCDRRRFHCWNGRIWEPDTTQEVSRLAKQTAVSVYLETSEVSTDADRKSVAAFARQCEKASTIDNGLRLLGSNEGIACRTNDFDLNPMLLAVENGTLDLETCTLREPDAEDLISKAIPVAYDPKAKCPNWRRFLKTVLRDQETIDYVQRALGYTLTGLVTEQCFFELYGDGSNGKSTFIEAAQAMLGPYSIAASFESFLLKSGESIRSDIAHLKGSRFVSATEPREGRKLDEGMIKQLTGGDTIRTRHLYGREFEYRPQFKIWLSTNHRIKIVGTDRAIWRRVRLLPFTQVIPESKKILDFFERQLRPELPGILSWAVEGLRIWNQNGLGSCAAVDRGTKEYREDMDPLAEFYETLRLDPTAITQLKTLMDEYRLWCVRSNRPLLYTREQDLKKRILARFPDVKEMKRGMKGSRLTGIRPGKRY